jgi:hypothetical protein
MDKCGKSAHALQGFRLADANQLSQEPTEVVRRGRFYVLGSLAFLLDQRGVAITV